MSALDKLNNLLEKERKDKDDRLPSPIKEESLLKQESLVGIKNVDASDNEMDEENSSSTITVDKDDHKESVS